MKHRLLAFMLLLCCFSSPGYALYFAGELTTSDALATDPGVGDFYYDMYYVSVEVPMDIYIFMTPTLSDPFAPWLGYWDGDFTESPDYYNPPPEDYETSGGVVGEQLIMSFNALPDIQYQIMAATWDYNPTDLGSYHFFILNGEGGNDGFMADDEPLMDPQEVPAPASWIVLALGLLITVLVNKSVPVSATNLARS